MATPQTTYNLVAPAGSAGFLADTDDVVAASYYNGEAADLPVGIGVVEDGATSGKAKLPAAATNLLAGIVFNTYGRDPNGLTTGAYATGSQIPVMQKGKCFVSPEQTVTPADPVYMRFAASVNTVALTQKGSFRKDADGVAGVLTVTPTVANSKIYVLRVEVAGKNFEFEFQSSGASSAAEIVTGFKTAMALDAEFTALVVATGANTLILTGQVAGASISAVSMGDGALPVAITTAPAATAVLVKGAKWLVGAAASGVATLHFDVNAALT